MLGYRNKTVVEIAGNMIADGSSQLGRVPNLFYRSIKAINIAELNEMRSE